MPRVLLLNTSFKQEGPNNTLLEIARHSRAEGVEVWAGALAGRGPAEGLYRRMGVPTAYFGRPGPADLGIASRVRRFVIANGINVVCSQLLRGEVVGALATRGIETCRLVCTVQNEDPYRITLRSPPKALLSRWALRRAHRVVVVSGSLRAFVARHQGVRPDLIEVIPNGVDSTAFTARAPAVRPGELPWGNPLVGCVGRLSRQKGQRVLISAFHRACDRLSEASLVLIGGGPDERSLKIAAASGRGRSRVHFLGWRRAVAPYLQHLDLYVQPSLWEGMPFATMEAMAASVPVVGSSAGGLQELLEGGCGTLVPPGRAAPIADAICTLAADPVVRERQGRAGRLRVHRNYRADQMASAYIRLFQTLADSAG